MKLTALLTVLCALALQILSNLINDYYDYKRGTDKQGRVGFKRALAEGLVNEKEMLLACLVTLAICLILGVILHGQLKLLSGFCLVSPVPEDHAH